MDFNSVKADIDNRLYTAKANDRFQKEKNRLRFIYHSDNRHYTDTEYTEAELNEILVYLNNLREEDFNNPRMLKTFTISDEVLDPELYKTKMVSNGDPIDYNDIFNAEHLIIKSSVHIILDDTFRGACNLEEVTIEDEGQELIVGSGAFSRCKKLSSIKFPRNTKFFHCTNNDSHYTFEFCNNLCDFDYYYTMEFNNSIAEILCKIKDGHYLSHEDGNLMYLLGNWNIHLNDTVIKQRLFYRTNFYQFVDLYNWEYIKVIEDHAFTGSVTQDYYINRDIKCEVGNIDLPRDLEELGDYAFSDTKYILLPDITIPVNLKKVGVKSLNIKTLNSITCTSAQKKMLLESDCLPAGFNNFIIKE